MRESIANSFLFNWILIFIGVIIALLIGSLSYSKAYKVKSRLISIIEKHEFYSTNNNHASNREIDMFLSEIGYKTSGDSRKCPSLENGYMLIDARSSFKYCVYRKDGTKGFYYKVIAYMYFDIPLVGDFLEFPVQGETKIIYDLR